ARSRSNGCWLTHRCAPPRSSGVPIERRVSAAMRPRLAFRGLRLLKAKPRRCSRACANPTQSLSAEAATTRSPPPDRCAAPAAGRVADKAVRWEGEALLLARHAMLGGELTRLAVARADTVVGKKTRGVAAGSSPPPCEEGSGVGVGELGEHRASRHSPPPQPSPTNREGVALARPQLASAPIGWRPAMPITQWTWVTT